MLPDIIILAVPPFAVAFAASFWFPSLFMLIIGKGPPKLWITTFIISISFLLLLLL
jgi:hypothetical protein